MTDGTNRSHPNSGTVDAAGLARFVDHIADLSLVFDEDVRAVVLRRPESERERLAQAADELGWGPEAALPAVVTSSEEELRAEWSRALGACDAAQTLWRDCAMWREVVAELTGSESTGTRFQRLARPMCPYFHHDYVPLRLLITYYGPTTEVVADPRIDSLGLGDEPHGDKRTARIEAAQLTTFQPRPGDVLILRGHGWPGARGQGAFHRSPLADEDNRRLFLAIEPVFVDPIGS